MEEGGLGLRAFRDASEGPSLFPLRLEDCLKGLAHMRALDMWRRESFDHFEYEFFSRLQNGYLNWIVPRKILAFSSPIENPKEDDRSLRPEAYLSLFRDWNVQLVIRLNKPLYDKKIFEKEGIKHLDLYFPDGSVPDANIAK